MSRDTSIKPMLLQTVAERLNRISEARGEAGTALEQAAGALWMAYNCFDSAYRAATEIDDAHGLSGSLAEELRGLCEHLQGTRNVLAESACVAVGLCPDRSRFADILRGTGDAAREGMQAKLLATWEAETLREAVVKALAGPEKR